MMWTKFIVHIGEGIGTVWNRNRIDTSFPRPRYANVTLWQWLVSSRESWVTRVTDQSTDGSHGSWVVKCDPLSALFPRPWRYKRHSNVRLDNRNIGGVSHPGETCPPSLCCHAVYGLGEGQKCWRCFAPLP